MQKFAALRQRKRSYIASFEAKDVEHVVMNARRGGTEFLEELELRAIVFIERDEFSVDDSVGGKRVERCDDIREFLVKGVFCAGKKSDFL